MAAVSLLALLTSMATAVIAWRALDQAGDAKAIALGGGGQAAPPIEPSAPLDGDSAVTAPVGDPETDPVSSSPPGADTSDPPVLNEQTKYDLWYQKQSITLRTASNRYMHADLDEPRADVPSSGGVEITLYGRYGNAAAYLRLGSGVQASQTDQPELTPHDCSERIRTAPLGTEAQVPARQGTVLCLWTSHAAALDAGHARRVVLLEITGVADDGAVTLLLTAWDIPQ
ncbi:hypothetical protein ACN27F_04605 [Solwaraspora sp. WMMB335]|uniref:hypothetical protein n=1 Tax=Solwaraspora sp. WMMB335 TaxID=3404118 RepID=UPI003B947E16